ncbi:hypothetical protein RB653_003917 [Dictyostelium firmibasis]|uniref:Serine protease K12H4.7 n=1 Tax=Dictyostelium firmibasis TaxID=79012 RepID=A0AAN7YRY5_9MYCE
MINQCNSLGVLNNVKNRPGPIVVDESIKVHEIVYQLFVQKVDHFNLLDDRTFNQRFIVNSKYWNGTGPVFFIINGESSMELDAVISCQYTIWAQKVSALIVSLEHRYYGGSHVMEDMSTDNLKYLTTQQALADCVVFIEWFTTKYYYVPPLSKIITFGGSYAGTLAAYLAMKYPSTISFSVASSAPLNPVVNFYQYMEVIQKTILSLENGEKCLKNIKLANNKIIEMVHDPILTKNITKLFGLCSNIELENDISTFMFEIANAWGTAAQYGNLQPGYPSLDILCKVMVDDSLDPLSNYINVWFRYKNSDDCIDVSYSTMISIFQYSQINHLNTRNDLFNMSRQWLFQTCTEFGFFITSDSFEQPFTNFNFNYQKQICADVFGKKVIQPSISWTLAEYGGVSPNYNSVKNVLFVSSSNDPWSSLSISKSEQYKTVIVENGTHCSDMIPLNNASVPDVSRAQNEIFRYILDVLN